MELLVQISEQLKRVCTLANCDHYELPSIVIIGEQNAGKTSLVENLIGVSFLPKGPDYMTRCPLELQISRKENIEIPDWAVFSNAPNCLITDFQHVRKQIELETKQRTNANGCYSGVPITLKIHSNKMVNLKLVDLPGLRKSTVGVQPNEVESLLIGITLKYISNLNTIILVAIEANNNMTSSEGFKLAKQVDPDVKRTLLVLTKFDLIEHQPNKQMNNVLVGNVKPVKLDITAVRNNSWSEREPEEANLLKKYYPQIVHKHNIAELIMTINQIMLNSVRNYLPKLKNNIILSLMKHKQSLVNYGEPVKDYHRTMLEIISNFSSAYTSTILGPYKEVQTEELTGGARINYIFREVFGEAIRNINPVSGLTKATLLTAIRNASGIKSTIFIPDNCFELLVKKQIKKLEGPSLRCAQLVYEELEKLIYNCGPVINTQLDRFPKLRQRIMSTLLELLKGRAHLTNLMVHQLINIHTAYINTGHPDFKVQSAHCNANQIYECSTDYNCQVRDLVTFKGGDITYVDHECLFIEKLISNYFNIVRTAIEDSVPKTIMHFLVNHTVENLQSELMTKLFINGMPNTELMTESNEIVQERQRTSDIVSCHEKAINILSDINETLK